MQFNIVYLDDEIELCQAFVDYYESDDIKIKTFTEPLKAVKAINEAPPDLLILDYRLPNISGVDVAHMVDKKILKILITGDIIFSSHECFDRVFGKPFDFDEVQRYIATKLELKRGSDQT